ncbi:SRPBCC family protein [Streptomyces hydrogenans]|uniref:SRPBCC family protein n=1 Tax=Streptomyces hydrogenans TaxID=1873719 RepID=UPI00332FE608
MSKVEESVEVEVPVRAAYDQWNRFETFPRFMDGVERIDRRTDRLTHWVTESGGVRREFDAVVTEQVPDERVAWTTVEGEASQTGVVTFHRLDERRTMVVLQMEFTPEGPTEQAGVELGFVKRKVTGELRRFKSFIEERGGQEPGAWHRAV